MKKYIGYIAAAIVVLSVLLFAWSAGNTTKPENSTENIQTEDVGELYADEGVTQSDEVQLSAKAEDEENSYKKTPVEEAAKSTNTVSLIVDCSDILTDINSLRKEKHGLVPDDGMMFSSADVEIIEGESVFDVLKRTLTENGVHLEFNLAPVTNSAYIEGIGNIYEFDCGERSGWKYSVNGEFPRVGCSDYKVKPGDKILFVYKVKAY